MGFESNPNYKNDIKCAIQLTKDVLSTVGAWPVPRTSIFKRLLAILLNVLSVLLLHFTLVPGFMNIFLKEENMNRKLKGMGPLSGSLLALSMLVLLLPRGKEFGECLKYLEEDWRTVNSQKDRQTMMDKAKIGHKIAMFSVVVMYFSGFFYRAMVLSRGSIVTPENVTIRPVPVPAYFVFFNPQNSPAYEIVCVLQCMSAFVQYAVTSGVFSLASLFSLHACGQLEILMERLRDLTNSQSDEDKTAEDKLAVIIEHHIRIRSFLRRAENFLQHMCLTEIVGTTLIMCLVGYYVITEWENSNGFALVVYLSLLLCFLYNIFILCFIGELLTDQGMQLFLTSCTLDWYRIPDRTARSLIFLIAATSTPMKITAGKLIDLSLNSFLAIVKTSVAYLNILRTMVT